MGRAAVLLYLIAYSITSLAAFGIITAVERVGSRTVMLEDVEGFFRVRPWGALSMGVCLLSLLGFPGTFGFIGKWYLMSAAIDRRPGAARRDHGPRQPRVARLLPPGRHGDDDEAGAHARCAPPGALLPRRRRRSSRWPSSRTCSSACGPRKVVDLARCGGRTHVGSRSRQRPERRAVNVPKGVFRQYDVRGIVGTELTPGVRPRARSRLRERGVGSLRARAGARGRPRQPAVGRGARRRRSARASSTPAAPRWTSASSRRPRSTSPCRTLKVDGGCQVTGSHNPPEFNGFKMVLTGGSMHGDDIIALWEAIVTERWRTGTGRGDRRRHRPGRAIATPSWRATSSRAR